MALGIDTAWVLLGDQLGQAACDALLLLVSLVASVTACCGAVLIIASS